MNYNFLCADCYQTFEAEADHEFDDQPCPDCGKPCTPLTSEEDNDIDYR